MHAWVPEPFSETILPCWHLRHAFNVWGACLVIAPTSALCPLQVHDRTRVSCLLAAESVAPPSVPRSILKRTMAARQLLAGCNQSACGRFTAPAPVSRLPSSMRPFGSPCRRCTRARGHTRKSDAATSSDTDIDLKRPIAPRQNARCVAVVGNSVELVIASHDQYLNPAMG